jgi:hypothetical protein
MWSSRPFCAPATRRAQRDRPLPSAGRGRERQRPSFVQETYCRLRRPPPAFWPSRARPTGLTGCQRCHCRPRRLPTPVRVHGRRRLRLPACPTRPGPMQPMSSGWSRSPPRPRYALRHPATVARTCLAEGSARGGAVQHATDAAALGAHVYRCYCWSPSPSWLSRPSNPARAAGPCPRFLPSHGGRSGGPAHTVSVLSSDTLASRPA